MHFGLIGYPLSHSFSQAYFTEKFRAPGLEDFDYQLIEVSVEAGLPQVLRRNLFGLNVTHPYKSVICSYLNEIDKTAWGVRAVNTMVRTGKNSWKGYNTDIPGFQGSLPDLLTGRPLPQRGLVLGSGGAARAVCHVLSEWGIQPAIVSRRPGHAYTYDTLSADDIQDHILIINATPLGTAPDLDLAPDIPYEAITPEHMLYDLVYNPANTLFLRRGQQMGARIKNGLDMLHRQAECAWAIWKLYGNF